MLNESLNRGPSKRCKLYRCASCESTRSIQLFFFFNVLPKSKKSIKNSPSVGGYSSRFIVDLRWRSKCSRSC